MAAAYRDLGTSVTLDRDPLPYLQGRAVGGTSVVNGAICWSFPEDVHRSWVAADGPLGEALPFEALARHERALVERLHIRPTTPAEGGEKAARMAAGADALGWDHRPIRRNVSGCRGAGRCLQGCPHGAKLSMDRTLLPDAVRDGARVLGGVRVERITTDRRGASGVLGTTAAGAPVEVRVWRGVVLAASACDPMRAMVTALTASVGRGRPCWVANESSMAGSSVRVEATSCQWPGVSWRKLAITTSARRRAWVVGWSAAVGWLRRSSRMPAVRSASASRWSMVLVFMVPPGSVVVVLCVA